MLHSWATDTDDPTIMPRWGKVGKQRIEDAGTLYPKRMETVDDEIRDNAFKFIDKAKADNKPFFLWLNPTRMHVVTHLSEKYEKMRNAQNGWTIQEAGIAQLDDIVGAIMKKLADDVGYTFFIKPGPIPGQSVAYWGPDIKVGVPQPALNLHELPGDHSANAPRSDYLSSRTLS